MYLTLKLVFESRVIVWPFDHYDHSKLKKKKYFCQNPMIDRILIKK